MLKHIGVLLLLPGISLAADPKPTVHGVSVSSVQLDSGTATITVLNLSQRDVTGFSIGITKEMADGQENNSAHTEDYCAVPHRAFHPGDTIEHIEPYDRTQVQFIRAEVIVAFYDDQTAEVKDDQQHGDVADVLFKEILEIRLRMAKATQQSATVFKNAANDPNPRERAKHDFDELIQDESNKDNVEFLKSQAALAASAPAGHEGEFLQEEGNRLQKQADARTRCARIRIRRLPGGDAD